MTKVSTVSVSDRIKRMSVVDASTGCWNWTGTKRHRGYGNMTTGSRTDGSRKQESVHRVSYREHVGKIPDGLWVLHHCDNPSCVNPEHLFLGDRQDNVDDRESKGRNKITRGEKHPRAKLTDAKAAEIYRRVTNGEVSRALAREFGIDKKTVLKIKWRTAWKHALPQPPKEREGIDGYKYV